MKRSFLIFALLAASACTHDRYLGRVTPGGNYVNRGFGVVVPLGDLPERWQISDPEHPERSPVPVVLKEERIDLDGDGMLRLDELVARLDPPLELRSKTSTGARMTLEVEILSEPAASKVTLRGLFDSEVRALAGNPTAQRLAIEGAERHQLGFEREALWTRIIGVDGGGAALLALVDQTGVVSEGGQPRRQLIRLRLTGPRLTPALERDHRWLMQHLTAGRESGRGTKDERW